MTRWEIFATATYTGAGLAFGALGTVAALQILTGIGSRLRERVRRED